MTIGNDDPTVFYDHRRDTRPGQAKAAAEIILKLLDSSPRLDADEQQTLTRAGLILGAIMAGER